MSKSCLNLCLSKCLKKRLWHMCFPAKFKKFLRKAFSSVGSGFQSGVAMEHWKALSTTMAGWQKKCLNSRRSRSKTLTFWPWWQPFLFWNYFFFFFVFLLSFCYAEKWGEGMQPPPPFLPLPVLFLQNTF